MRLPVRCKMEDGNQLPVSGDLQHGFINVGFVPQGPPLFRRRLLHNHESILASYWVPPCVYARWIVPSAEVSSFMKINSDLTKLPNLEVFSRAI